MLPNLGYFRQNQTLRYKIFFAKNQKCLTYLEGTFGTHLGASYKYNWAPPHLKVTDYCF